MKLEGEVPIGYRGVPDYGRDWLERGHYPKLSGPGFAATLAVGLLMLNGAVVLVPLSKVYLAVCAAAVVGGVVAAMPVAGTEDKGDIGPISGFGLVLLLWAAWLAFDFADSAAFHRHLVLTSAALFFATAWHWRQCRFAWWRVIPTSNAWNEHALSAYAEFLAAHGSRPYAKVVARELFRTVADLALRPAEPSQRQLDAIRRYVEVLREGLGGFPDFREARWWKDKLNEFEDRARDERLHLRGHSY